jgi:hypothetical protein
MKISEDHIYTEKGKELESVSHYIERHKQPFPKEFIAQKTAERDGREMEDVLEEWELKGKMAREFGSSVHSAIELYAKYRQKPHNAFLASIVDQWVYMFQIDKIHREIAVYDTELAGTIDEIEITGEKRCIIRDLKTNFDLYKKGKKMLPPYDFITDSPIDCYTLQLNLYKRLAEYHGWTVEKLEIVHLDGDKLKVIDIPIWKN